MKRKLVASFCAGLTAMALAPQTAYASPELEAKVKALEEQLAALKTMILQEKQDRQQEAVKLTKEVAKISGDPKQGGNSISLSPNTTLSYGGFIKYNAMYDDYQDGATPGASVASRILVPSLIPVGDSSSSEGFEFNSDVATSRFFFKTSTDTSAGKINSYVELDFLAGGGDERVSNSNSARIRHAVLDWKYSDDSSLLAGQTWSTFFNPGALPESVEFIGPTAGTIFNRQQQVRWTKGLGGGNSLMFSIENPSTSLAEAGGGISGSNFDDNALPDFIARYNGKSGAHSYAISGLAREIGFDNGITSEKDLGFAMNIAGKYVLENGNDIRYSFAHGNLGRYIALNAFRDGGIDANGNLDLTTVTGGYLAYRHKWSDKWRSTLQLAYSSADLADGLASTNTEKVSNINLNLMYSPTPKLSFGGEIIQASRELENGTDGDLTRLQFTAKYGF